MRTHTMTGAIAAVLVSGAACAATPAQGPTVLDCDRACLTGLIDQYLAGMLAHDPKRVPWASHVRFTENNVPMRIGDGLWGTIDKLGGYKVYFADSQAGQAGFYGVVSEGSKTSVYGLRMQVQDRGTLCRGRSAGRTTDQNRRNGSCHRMCSHGCPLPGLSKVMRLRTAV